MVKFHTFTWEILRCVHGCVLYLNLVIPKGDKGTYSIFRMLLWKLVGLCESLRQKSQKSNVWFIFYFKLSYNNMIIYIFLTMGE